MRQTTTIIAILFFLLLLGIWGQYELDPEKVLNNPASSAYRILMLFFLEGEWTNVKHLPWQLEVTRFLAPLAGITGLLFVLTRGAWIRLTNYFVRFSQDQVIVAGLGEKAWQFISSCHRHYRVIVVEINKDDHYSERARSLGVSVIVGDILEPSMFDKVNLVKARHLVAYTDNDGVNVEMAIKARNYIDQRVQMWDHQLRIHIHVNNTRISQRLENYPKFFDHKSAAEINFFSVYELNARLLFDQYPPERYADVLGRKQVHIALFHFGRLGEHILLEAARICHFANNSRVRFTVFDEDAARREKDVCLEYPYLRELIDVTFTPLPIRQASSIENIPEELLSTITEHVICLPTDEESFTLALVLRSTILKLSGCNSPILVRMRQSSGLAQLLESNLGQPEIPDGLYPFGMLDQTLHFENILSDRLDKFARVLHEDYLKQKLAMEKDERSYSALNEWASLPEPEKKSNRLEADHILLKLRAIRCVTSEGNGEILTLKDDEAELLASMEHTRWRANKVFEGWRPGAVRIEKAGINPYTIGWSEMPDKEKQAEIEAIKRLPQLLYQSLGLTLKRELVIGVTGHRLHKMDPGCSDLQAGVERELQKLVDSHPHHKFVIVSPLAEGVDRLVARIAMEKFSMALRVPIPLPYELYQSDFTSYESVEEFKELVGKAEFYFELPMKFGSVEQLAVQFEDKPNRLRDQQYALAGAYLVERCDVLIAIYDESPETGTGGTGQVVRWRKNRRVDDVFNNPSDFFSPPDIEDPIVLIPNASKAG